MISKVSDSQMASPHTPPPLPELGEGRPRRGRHRAGARARGGFVGGAHLCEMNGLLGAKWGASGSPAILPTKLRRWRRRPVGGRHHRLRCTTAAGGYGVISRSGGRRRCPTPASAAGRPSAWRLARACVQTPQNRDLKRLRANASESRLLY